ncbi:hypothetical protein ACVWW2_003968 [Bradyrhizobium sp. LM4.3]
MMSPEPAHHEADLAGRERAEIFGRMKLAHGGPNLGDDIGRLLKVRLPGRVRIEPEIIQRRRKNVVGGVEHVDAAVFEFCQILRLEHDVPAVDLRVRSQNLLQLRDIVADARRAPHVVGGVDIAGIVDRETFGHHRPGIGEVRQLRLVELLEDIRLDLALEEIGCRHYDVIAGLTGHQARLQRLVGIKRVVDHLDAGLPGEGIEDVRRHVVRPVVEVDDPLFGPGGTREPRQRRGERETKASP